MSRRIMERIYLASPSTRCWARTSHRCLPQRVAIAALSTNVHAREDSLYYTAMRIRM